MIGHVRQYLKTAAWCRRLGLGLAGSLYNLHPASPLVSLSPSLSRKLPRPLGYTATLLFLVSVIQYGRNGRAVTPRAGGGPPPSLSAASGTAALLDRGIIVASDLSDGRFTADGVTLGLAWKASSGMNPRLFP